MQKQNEQMPHGLPQKCPPKNIINKNQEKNFFGGAAAAADQVQGGLGHGELEEGQKKKQNFFGRTAFALHKRFFSFGGSKT